MDCCRPVPVFKLNILFFMFSYLRVIREMQLFRSYLHVFFFYLVELTLLLYWKNFLFIVYLKIFCYTYEQYLGLELIATFLGTIEFSLLCIKLLLCWDNMRPGKVMTVRFFQQPCWYHYSIISWKFTYLGS